MRFGKANRNWVAAGRRLFKEQEYASGAVATEERNALLGFDASEEPFTAPSPEPAMKGDPTQHLLTALGRFQRQISKAENGAPQSIWSDECMNQIIAGIEIALEQEWESVKEALTDTARILQSFEDAECAEQCVPFLRDSYEILCLMVGDIIVDNVRSGVLQKWRDRYQAIVEDMHCADIRLVDDDAREEEQEQSETGFMEEEAPIIEEVQEEPETIEAPDEPSMENADLDEAPPSFETASTEASVNAASTFTPEAFQEETIPAPVEEQPAPVPVEISNKQETPLPASGDLFQNVREAVQRGNVTEAKNLALQVALEMARIEADRQESQVRSIEQERAKIADALQIAQKDIERTRMNLEASERFSGESQAEFQSRREHAENLHCRITEIENSIAGIDAQIQELRERRAAEEQRLESTQIELDEVLSVEGRYQSELDALADSEQSARAALELSERNVAALQQDLTERDADIEAARIEWVQRKQAVAELERTIGQVAGGNTAPAPGETGMLF
ncbi:MAG TPA: hypothetical protein PLI09_09490 [Candidatus Hydrogenedentes bacterium]|nr:hypothetical protein [Candidatus Hydrogenedentota bacterium]